MIAGKERKKEIAKEEMWLHRSLSVSEPWADGSSLNQFSQMECTETLNAQSVPVGYVHVSQLLLLIRQLTTYPWALHL